MDFNIVSKNNIGAVVALLLVVILSQARFFNFLLDNALGRTILIGLILFISYTNQILGVVSILFIIIFFNNSDIGYMEGFTSTSETMKKEDTNDANANMEKGAKNGTSATMKNGPSTTMKNGPSAMNDESATNGQIAMNNESVNKATGTEGFDITGKESAIKRGKQSNQIPVAKTTGIENFEPYSGYSQSYSSF
jgi:hypothetical protein